MTKAKRQKATGELVKPKINRVVEPIITPGAADFIKEGKPLPSGRPGTLLLLAGRGFGKDPAEVVVNFGAKTVDAFPKPLFSEKQILVTVPIMPKGSVPISATVAGVKSNKVSFLIKSLPVLPQPPGTLTKKAVSTFDAFVALTAAEMKHADFGTLAPPGFKDQLIENLLEQRRGLLIGKEKLEDVDSLGDYLIDVLEIRDKRAQEFLRRASRNTVKKALIVFDEITEASRIIPQLEMEMALIRQGGKGLVTTILEVGGEGAAGVGNFFDSLESAAGSLGLSGEAGVALGASLSGDAETNLQAPIAVLKIAAEGISSLLKIGGIISSKIDSDGQEAEGDTRFNDVITRLGMLESKADKQGGAIATIGGKVDKLEEKADKQGGGIATIDGKVNKLEEKADKQGGAIASIDTQIKKGEVKKDRIEGKLDKSEVKLDRIEEKLDKNEIKKDRIEAKLDKLEPKIDKLESKADKTEGKLDKLEGKADKAEGKLDKMERKADRAEGKLDKLEPKIDKLEPKLDKLEGKADKAEGKLDKLEPKLDKLEPKIDKLEPKLDRLQVSADRTKEFWQFESASWNVDNASSVGVQVQSSLLLPGPTTLAFNVESIQVLTEGFKVVKVIVDDLPTDISGLDIVTPSNVVVDIGIGLIGASRSVKIEFDKPYSGPVEFNGEKPQGVKLCTVVEGAGSSQTSPNVC